MRALLGKRRGNISDRHYHAVRLDLASIAVFVRDSHFSVLDLFHAVFEKHRHFLVREIIPEVGRICKTEPRSGDDVVLRFDNDGTFAFEEEIVRDLAARQTAAHDDDVVAHRRAVEIIYRLDALFYAGNAEFSWVWHPLQ